MSNPDLSIVPHPEDEFFDDARIQLHERWKQSGVSGSEWRFSYRVELFRKGLRVAYLDCGSMQHAAIDLARALSMGLAEIEFDSSEWVVTKWEEIDRPELCCQPGCVAPGTVVYRVKQQWDKSCSMSRPFPDEEGEPIRVRRFCKRHAYRGDSGLDDGPTNYEPYEGT